jgi:hypothetical protein
MHLSQWGEVGLITHTPFVYDQSPYGLTRPNGQSLIRARRHIIKLDSGLLIRYLDLGLRLDHDPGG